MKVVAKEEKKEEAKNAEGPIQPEEIKAPEVEKEEEEGQGVPVEQKPVEVKPETEEVKEDWRENLSQAT